MKKIAIAIIATIALAGCASNAPTPTVTVTATPEAPAPAPVPTDEELFIATMESEYGPINTRNEKALIDSGYDLCISFDTVGVKQTIIMLANTATSKGEARMIGYFVGAATQSFCPEYTPQLEKIFGVGGISA